MHLFKHEKLFQKLNGQFENDPPFDHNLKLSEEFSNLLGGFRSIIRVLKGFGWDLGFLVESSMNEGNLISANDLSNRFSTIQKFYSC